MPLVGMSLIAWISGAVDHSLGSPVLYVLSWVILAGNASAMFVLDRRQPQWMLLFSPYVYLTGAALLILSQSNSHAGLGIVILVPVLAVAVRGTRLMSAAVVAGMVGTLLAISLIHNQPYIVILRTLTLWTAMGAVLSMVIHGLRENLLAAQQELEQLASIDPLTGLINRRAFDDAVEQRRGRRPFAIACIDLDGFKAVNDTSGHDAGDRLLSGVARACEHIARGGDVVARFGGDEFVVFLADADDRAARIATDRIRHAIEAVNVDGHQAHASVGYATGTPDALLDDVLRRADERMYGEKRVAHLIRRNLTDAPALAPRRSRESIPEIAV